MSDEIVERKVRELQETLKKELGEIELNVTTEGITLSQLMREGCKVTEKETGGWGSGETACSNSAAYLAAKARGLLD